MKKILEKVVSIAVLVVGLIFITLLLVVIFGSIEGEELNNQLVQVLVISLSVIFGVLGAIMIISAFNDGERLNSILIFKDKESATKAAVPVVKSLVKTASNRVEEAKVNKVVLLGDDNNNVKLVVYIKIKSDDTEDVIKRVRAEIMATCYKVLEYQFSTVDFRITKVKSNYTPSQSEIDAQLELLQKNQLQLSTSDEEVEQTDKETILVEETLDNVAPSEQENQQLTDVDQVENDTKLEKEKPTAVINESKKEEPQSLAVANDAEQKDEENSTEE